MPRISPAPVYALLLSAACSAEQTDGAGALVTEPLARAASVPLPISGSCDGTFDIIPINPPEDEPSIDGRVVSHASCHIAHLGRSVVTGEDRGDFDIAPLVLVGDRLFVAANGDHLRASIEYTVPVPSEDGTFTSAGTLTFSGGTGRFRNATGVAEVTGGGQLDPATSFVSFKGTISAEP